LRQPMRTKKSPRPPTIILAFVAPRTGLFVPIVSFSFDSAVGVDVPSGATAFCTRGNGVFSSRPLILETVKTFPFFVKFPRSPNL